MFTAFAYLFILLSMYITYSMHWLEACMQQHLGEYEYKLSLSYKDMTANAKRMGHESKMVFFFKKNLI